MQKKLGARIRRGKVPDAINGLGIKAHLKEQGVSAEHIRSIMNPEDKQDVRLAFDLLKAVWTLPRTPVHNNTPGFARTREALWVFGQFLYHVVLPYLCTDLTLSEQLEHLGAASHLAMFLYRTDGKDCLPTLLYTDIMIMLKNAFFCVAKAKVDNPNGSFWIILLGTDRLEELFGNLRTMIGNDANLDILQVSWRLSSTAEVANILARFPHWDRPPRRLNFPPITRNAEPLPSSTDHLKPSAWKDKTKLKVRGVTLQTSWSVGRRMIEQDIPGAKEEFAKMEKEQETRSELTIDILSPNGKLLVNISGTTEATEADEDLESDGEDGHEHAEGNDELREDNAEARVEVEDELGVEDEEDNSAGPNTVERTILVNGKHIPKARALSIFSKYQYFPVSRDRLKRVRHEVRYSAHTNEAPSTIITDPDARILVEDTVRVSFQLTGLRASTTEDDPDEKNDWRTYPLSNDHTFTVPGRFIEPINPDPASHSSTPSALFYLLDSAFLVALSATLLESLSLSDLKLLPKLAATSYFPYREAKGKACFLCEDDRELSSAGTATTVECEFCSPPPVLDLAQSQRVLEHMAAHVLFDPKVKASDEPCGLCLRPLTVDKKKSECKYSVKFYYHSAASSTSTSPCSNVPVACPLCPTGHPAVWKYNLKEHFRRKHPSQLTKPEYSQLWHLSQFELRELKEIWKKRHAVVTRRMGKKKASKDAIVVSDEHRSSNTTMYVPFP
ncbi:hypothetical protein DFP72DRAFT_822195 [Ephemerocybe angulata]|uniref:Uncharacterized protein n=1 Tax=Ephemerocybe angulata TaxID=980116 RepID=A0A8H6HIN2_9AGAR|nr:hypothetical protein DFP72DRAFT_822195 [Tulosesus angulatus]